MRPLANMLLDYLKDGAKTRKEIEKKMYNRGLDIGRDTLLRACNILDIDISREQKKYGGTLWTIKH